MSTPLQTRIAEVLALADKATPGPWKYDDGITDDETGDRGKPQCVASVNLSVFGKLIAEPYGHEPDGHESDACIPSMAESDANGALIAAAPEMADLLREASAENERLTTALADLGVTPEEARAGAQRSKDNAAERDRLRAVTDAAKAYYDRYMVDEAEDVENCVCGIEQHERAAALRDALKVVTKNRPESSPCCGRSECGGECGNDPLLAPIAQDLKYCWSTDGEMYHDAFATAEEAIAKLNGRGGFVAEIQPVELSDLVDTDSLIDTMICRAGDEAGEAAEDWLSFVKREDIVELHDAIMPAVAAWVEKHDPISFWGVTNPISIAAKERGE